MNSRGRTWAKVKEILTASYESRKSRSLALLAKIRSVMSAVRLSVNSGAQKFQIKGH